MTFPDFYTPQRIGELYTPNVLAATQAGREAGLKPSLTDEKKIYLLLIDMQVDFVHPDGALSVPGAVDDTKRVIDWVYNNAGSITTIGASLDSHYPIQIFHPLWWVDAEGNHPDPYTPIPSAEVKAGKWKPLYQDDWSVDYVEKLEENAKKQLMIWPFHTLIGTPGHTLVPALYEAIAYHSAARQSQPRYITKGTLPESEYYSAMEPEVKVPNVPHGDLNKTYLDELAQYDILYITGQAKSHCVLETVSSMMRYYPPEIVAKMRVLQDGMSSVAHPEIDFDAMADESFARFKEKGLTMTETSAELG